MKTIVRNYSIEEILPQIASTSGLNSKITLGEYQVNNGSLRLSLFATKGTKCVACGLEATHFILEFGSEKDVSPHLNLYGIKSGENILFTKDHIIPLSKGGENNLKNLQTMCTKCNSKKGDTL